MLLFNKMIRNNFRDPKAKSIWLKQNDDYDVGIKPSDCYSNLSIYGTHYGTNSTHSYPAQQSMYHLGGGIVKKIEVPYPIEPVPEIMLKLGQPHPYDSGYKKHKKLCKNCHIYESDFNVCSLCVKNGCV